MDPKTHLFPIPCKNVSEGIVGEISVRPVWVENEIETVSALVLFM